jgi:hypothetical protein
LSEEELEAVAGGETVALAVFTGTMAAVMSAIAIYSAIKGTKVK